MAGKIDVYLDCISPFSQYAFEYLIKNRAALLSYGVDVEFHPVFLSGIVNATGNTPPFKLPAKGQYLTFDRKRAATHFGVPFRSTPSFFPVNTVVAQRCMIYIKEHYSTSTFESAFRSLWAAIFEQHLDISKPETLRKVFEETFKSTELDAILEAGKNLTYKQKLEQNTQKAIELGAFGTPFCSVKNGKGEIEPFFGSDRFHYMFDFLGLPVSHLAIKEKSSL